MRYIFDVDTAHKETYNRVCSNFQFLNQIIIDLDHALIGILLFSLFLGIFLLTVNNSVL